MPTTKTVTYKDRAVAKDAVDRAAKALNAAIDKANAVGVRTGLQMRRDDYDSREFGAKIDGIVYRESNIATVNPEKR